MKVALLFLTRGELYNSDIWDTFFDENLFNIYIHPDIGYDLKDYKKYQIRNPSFKKRGYNILGSLRLLRESLKKEENYKFVLLSEDCIPLTGPNDFYDYCIKDGLSDLRYGKSWIKEGEGRFINEIPEKDQMANSDWWILNRSNAECISNNSENILNVYSKYSNNGEHAPSTILNLSGQLNNSLVKNRDVLYENYPYIDSGGNYAEMCGSQFEELRQDVIKRGYFFIRKYKKTGNISSENIAYTHWAGIRDYDVI